MSCSHTRVQKSSMVDLSGPWTARYSLLELQPWVGNENITLLLERVAQGPQQPRWLRQRPGKEGTLSRSGGIGKRESTEGRKGGQPKLG